ncbi:MAG: hypothetical protein WCQ60_00315 [bacterium]
MKKTFLYLASLLVVTAIVLAGVGSHLPRATADAQTTLNGYGWSDTIGWISFNCLQGNSTGGNICPTSNYGVSKDSLGNLTGYAWSDNIGWIKFGGLSGFPNTTYGTDAKVSGSGALTGWARAVVGVGRSDGWDGWISLSGVSTGATPTAYGVSFDGTGASSGYAWGSDVVGWTALYTTSTTTPVASISLSIDKTSILPTDTATLSWTNTTANIDMTKPCVLVTNAVSTTTVAAGVTAYTVGPFSATGTRAYTVTCMATVAAGAASTTSNIVNLDVSTAPDSVASIALTFGNGQTSTSIATGTSASLTWMTTNIDTTRACSVSGAVSATVSAGVTTFALGTFTTTGTRTYMVTCKAISSAGGADTNSNIVTLTVTGSGGPGGVGSCVPISNATMCSYEGSATSGLSPSRVVTSCSATEASPQPTLCEYTCNYGFRQLGNTCVLNSTIQEN